MPIVNMPTRSTTLSRGQSGEDVRQHNLSLVLKLVHVQGSLSRSQITTATGLNRSTISDLVAELSELGLITESEGLPASGVGRPSLMVSPASDIVAFAVHPEVDATTVAVVSLSGKVVAKERKLMSVAPTPEQSIQTASALIMKLRKNLGPKVRITGVGVCVPGQVRSSDGVIRLAPQLRWVESAFGPALSQAVNLPVFLDNDASLGCMAERNFGAAKGLSDVVFLFAGAGGIGGGVIVDDHQLRGAAGYAGELGHVRIATSRKQDFSGFEGTLEALIRRDDLLDIFKLYVATDEELDAEIKSSQSPKAQRLIEDQIDILGEGLSAFVNIFNPEVIVLGGFLTSLFEFDPERLINKIHQGSLDAASERVIIRKGALGSNLLMIGGAELPFSALISRPSSFSLTKP